jgi:hypothetical protein
MDTRKRRKLESVGWRAGDAAEFLGLSEAESRLIDLRLGIARATRQEREARGLTQKALAALAGTTQARIAKLGSAWPELSLDLMLRVFFTLGGGVKPEPIRRARRARTRTRNGSVEPGAGQPVKS